MNPDMIEITSTLYDLKMLLPMIIISVGALVVLMGDVFFRSSWPSASISMFTVLAAIASIAIIYSNTSDGLRVVEGLMYVDPFALICSGIILLGSIFSIVLSKGRLEAEGISSTGEYYMLLLVSAAGACMLVSAAELITLFLALEIMSMALYCLCGSAVHSTPSSESSLKYFFLGSFSSAFLLFGISLLYGLTGTTMIPELAAGLASSSGFLTPVVIALFVFGLLFKVGVVPFHFWVPDVYQGAPTPVAAFMACAVKVSAVAVSLRLFTGIFSGAVADIWIGAVWLCAALTMIIANIIALRQRSLKRMLAYSSIGHAGYLLLGLIAPEQISSGAAVVFYLVTYTVMTMGAFGVVLLVSQEQGSDDITVLNGYAKLRPLMAVLMTLFMLSLAGLPPAISGFVSKFYLFASAVQADFTGLVVIAVLCSAVSCFYYLRVIVAMYFLPLSKEGEEAALARTGTALVSNDRMLVSMLLLCGVAVVAIGVLPGTLYDLAVAAIESIH